MRAEPSEKEEELLLVAEASPPQIGQDARLWRRWPLLRKIGEMLAHVGEMPSFRRR